MRPVRLLVLGALAAGGPMHGYQIRQEALRDQVELWTQVKPGSLYSALHRMAQDGLVAVARVERSGTSPERTVYRITAAGRRELIAQRDAGLIQVVVASDPLDLALRYVSDLTAADLTAVITSRHTALADRLAEHERALVTAGPHLAGLERAAFDHVLQRLRTEVTWHEQLLAQLRSAPGESTPGPADGGAPSHTPPQRQDTP